MRVPSASRQPPRPPPPARAASAGGRAPSWDGLYLEDGESVLAAFDVFASVDGGPG